jgi:hypothetical protein
MRDLTLQFLSLTGFPSMVDFLSDSVVGNFRRALEGEMQATLEDRGKKALALLEESLKSSQGVLQEQVVDLYAKVFSEEDMKALVDFYQTDTGKKLVEKGASIQGSIGDLGSDWSNNVIRSLESQFASILGESQ